MAGQVCQGLLFWGVEEMEAILVRFYLCLLFWHRGFLGGFGN